LPATIGVSGQAPLSPSKMIPSTGVAPIPTKTPMAPMISPAAQSVSPIAAPQAVATPAAPAPAPATAAPTAPAPPAPTTGAKKT
jgi:hypothetical protein